MMWVPTEALLLILGSGVADCEIKAVLLNLRSLLAGFAIGVATKVALTCPMVTALGGGRYLRLTPGTLWRSSNPHR
jgi:ABC-type uncharacterized transport system YnjBCD permease subunit